MFNIGQAITRNCQGITRRELLQAGGVSLLGVTLAGMLRSEASTAPSRRSEKSCIFNPPGIGGGVFGSSCDPIEIRDPFGRQVQLSQFSLTADVTPERFGQRRALLAAVDDARARAIASPAIERMDTVHQRAADMLT